MTDLAAAAELGGVEPVHLVCAISPLNDRPHTVHFSDGIVRPFRFGCLTTTTTITTTTITPVRLADRPINIFYSTRFFHSCTHGPPPIHALVVASAVAAPHRQLRGHSNLIPDEGGRQRPLVLQSVLCVAATTHAVGVAAVVFGPIGCVAATVPVAEFLSAAPAVGLSAPSPAPAAVIFAVIAGHK